MDKRIDVISNLEELSYITVFYNYFMETTSIFYTIITNDGVEKGAEIRIVDGANCFDIIYEDIEVVKKLYQKWMINRASSEKVLELIDGLVNRSLSLYSDNEDD